MNEQPFEALTRRAAKQVSRRVSLQTIGATGLTGVLGGLRTAAAKKNKLNHKRDKKKAQQRAEQECEDQVAQCQSTLGTIGGIPINQITCCAFLGACDFRQFSLCFFGA